MQTIYPKLNDLARKLKSRKARRRMGKLKSQQAREKLWLGRMRHKDQPGFASF